MHPDLPADWWRHHAWGADGPERLEDELRRVPAWARAHRLRVKAHVMLLRGDADARAAAERLLRRLLTEHGGQLEETSAAHRLLADAHARRRADERAEWHLRRALAAEEEHGGICSDAAIALAELIVRTGQAAKFSEADDLLDHCERRADTLLLFSEPRLRHAVAAARLARIRGDERLAAAYARAALAQEGAEPDAVTGGELRDMLRRAA